MSTIKILAGDFKVCDWVVSTDSFGKEFKIYWGLFGSGDSIDLKMIH